MKQKIIVNDPYQLMAVIEKEMLENGNQCNLNHIDVSNIKDMIAIFAGSEFNGNISNWDVSNVVTMMNMFSQTPFNQDISNWNVSKLINMDFMFTNSEFNKNLSKWTPYNLNISDNCFLKFNVPIPYWANYEEKEEREKAIKEYIIKCSH